MLEPCDPDGSLRSADLPGFTQLSWVSDAAREVWEPRLKRITSAWLELEWRSVVVGLRPCGVTMVSAADLVSQAGDWVRNDLSGVPLEICGQNAASGEPLVYRIVVGATENVRAFREAWDVGDDEEMGRLLGFPVCCVEFSRRVREDDGLTDTTWPMALSTVMPEGGTRCVDVEGPPETNILWRWMGVRPVPHLPCRFDCEASVELGRRFVVTGRQAGFREEMDWLLEILSWPAEWSALHGTAEIETPLLKVSARTDPTTTKYTVRRHGPAYPAEGVRGLEFPYRRPRIMMTAARGLKFGLANPESTEAALTAEQ